MMSVFCTYGQDILDGWYFNPDQPGNGFNVNTQADITGVALFDFEQDGDNQWATAVDQLSVVGDYEVFEADLRAPLEGSCFECQYQPNSGNASGDTITIRFQIAPNDAGNTIAEVTLRGHTEVYERQLFRFSSPLDYMLAEWNLIEVFELTPGSPIPFADIARFDSIGTTSDGQPFVAGELISDDGQPIVILQLPDSPLFAMLAEDAVGTDARAWIYFAYKNTLVGFTDFGDDPLNDIINNPESASELRGSRTGNTLNRNNAIDLDTRNQQNSLQAERVKDLDAYQVMADQVGESLIQFDAAKIQSIMRKLIR